MKQVIIIIGFVVVMMLVFLTLLSVQGRTDRRDELDRAVAAAVKQTVKDSQIENQTSITSDQEMVAQFIQNVCTGIVSDGDLQIQIMGVDYKEGMLDVLVTEQFSYFNGKKAQISIRKCAVYE